MPDMVRKQRLRTLEKEIRSGMEEFYYTGMRLLEIRRDRLYKEDGFSSFEKYVKERFDMSERFAHHTISSAEYRAEIKECPTGTASWTERSVRELKRIPDKRQAARVAAKVVKEVEAGKAKLTAATVRKHVDRDLGVDRTPEKKPIPKPVSVVAYIRNCIGRVEAMHENLAELSADNWTLLSEEQPLLAEEFATVCSELAGFMRQ